jgi:chloramphenicol-sensitive protein RarD
MNQTATPSPSRTRSGLLYGLAAYGLWGVVPVYFNALAFVSPVEMLAQRVAWTAVLMAAVLTPAGRWGDLARCLRPGPVLRTLLASTALIATNWLTYIYGVVTHQLVEASLGYFIAPLASVLLGRLVLHERLRRLQLAAILLAAAGVLLEVAAQGRLPWIALALAGSFSTYGLLRKRVPVDGVLGLSVETLLLLPPALAYLGYEAAGGTLVFGHTDRRTDVLLALSGAVTAVPLICFAQAARRLPLATLGFLQFLSPTVAMLIAVLVFREPFTAGRAWSFAFIWAGLAVFVADSVRAYRAFREKTAAEAATPATPEPEMELERG